MPERTSTVFGAVASGVTLALAIGCSTPGPDTFKAATVQSTSVETIAAFVRAKLEFDSVLGADSALVDLRQGLIGGKAARRARIEPERRSFRLSAQDAAEGRIIARIRTDDTIPSLGLGPWWTWWWVDSIGTGHWRSVLIPEHGKPPITTSKRSPGSTWSAQRRLTATPSLSRAGVTRVGAAANSVYQ